MSTCVSNETMYDQGTGSVLFSALAKPVVQKSNSIMFNAGLKPRQIRGNFRPQKVRNFWAIWNLESCIYRKIFIDQD